MKVTEFTFENEQDHNKALDIAIQMDKEKENRLRPKRSYVVVTLGDDDAQDYSRRLDHSGVAFVVTGESAIRDDLLETVCPA